ncbi:MAG TPA: PIN domain-containing protein [Mycobacteriales bacterium]
MTGSGATALADTSLFIAIEQGRPLRSTPPANLKVSWITVAELKAGVLEADTPTVTFVRELTLRRVEDLIPLPVDRVVAQAWAELRATMREIKRRLSGNDMLIAATAIAHGLPVASQDDDFADIPGLRLIQL